MPYIHIISLKIFWRMEIKSNSPQGPAHCQVFWRPTHTYVSRWTAGMFGISPRQLHWGGDFQEAREGTWQGSASRIRYCAPVITKSTFNPEPSSGGSYFWRGKHPPAMVHKARWELSVLRQPHPRHRPVGRIAGERAQETPQRDIGLMRKPVSPRTQVQGQIPPSARPQVWVWPVKQTPPPNWTKVRQGPWAQTMASRAVELGNWLHLSCHSEPESRCSVKKNSFPWYQNNVFWAPLFFTLLKRKSLTSMGNSPLSWDVWESNPWLSRQTN